MGDSLGLTALIEERPPQQAPVPDSGPSTPVQDQPLGEAVTARQDLHALSTLLQLEQQARLAQGVKELHFFAVNETRRLISYRQAYLFQAGSSLGVPCRMAAASSLPTIERHTPCVQWMERTLHSLRKKTAPLAAQQFTEENCPPDLRPQWKEFSLPYVVWCPLQLTNGTVLGGMWLAKEKPWQDSEITVAQRLADTIAHAWGALQGTHTQSWKVRISKKWLWLAVLGMLLAMALPVQLSTLAPAEIVAQDPAIVAAPLDGVIADILVPPNTLVNQGDLLFVYEDTVFRNEYDIAGNNLARSLAEHRKAAQGGFLEEETTAQIPLLKAEVQLRETERDYARERLALLEVRAPRAGLLLYTDQAEWIGRPVEVGQRIMDIADPNSLELRVNLPVDDAIVLHNGAPVTVFLDARPLEPIHATVTHASYHAEVMPGDILAYRVLASLQASPDDLRIGWRGTAKIYGDDTHLFFLVFRRPMSAARQFLGL